jgi:ribosomal protein S18 acetylase RimI-like enzyme
VIEIVPATVADAPLIRQVALATWPATFGDILSAQQIDYMLEMMYSLGALRGQMAEQNHRFLLAQEAGQCLGYLSYETDYQGLPKTKVHKVYVLPQAQGRGVGQLLFARVYGLAAAHHNPTLTLNVNRNNAAIRFYEKQGFVKVAEENIDIGQGFWMEDAVMEKKIDLLTS